LKDIQKNELKFKNHDDIDKNISYDDREWFKDVVEVSNKDNKKEEILKEKIILISFYN